MAKYRIKGPDGATYEVTAPDDATQDQVLAYVQSQHAPKADFNNVQAGTPTTQPSTKIDGQTVGQMSGFNRFGYGIAAPIADTVVGLSEITGIGSPEWQRETMQRVNAAQSTGAGKVGSVAGNIGMAFAVPELKALKAAPLLRGAASGALFGATRGTNEGESRLVNTATGAGLGAAGTGIAGLLGRYASKAHAAIPELKREMIGVADRYGIPLHVSQLTDSLPAKVAASAAKYLPFTGAGKSAQAQQAAFNDALSQTMGNTPGIARPLSDDAMRATGQRIGQIYNDVYGRNNVSLAPASLSRMSDVYNRAVSDMTPENAAIVGRQLDRIINTFADGGAKGAKYQNLRGDLASAASKNPGAVGDAIKALRRELDDAAAQSVGDLDASALKAANAQWANYRTVQDALKQRVGAGENVAPGNLWNLIRKGSTKDMRELARLGKTVLQDPIPDSGTGGRNLFYALFGPGLAGAKFSAGTTLAPAAIHAGAGITAGRLLNSPLFARAMLNRGQGATALIPYTQALPAATPAIAPFWQQYPVQDSNGP
jgi:hypothetical protein